MVGGLVFTIAGAILGGIALLARAEKLPRNYFVGIRLPSTLRSQEAWLAAHRAAWAYMALSGALMIVAGVLVLINDDDPPAEWLLVTVVVIPLLIGAVKAHLVARAQSPPSGTPGHQ